MLDTNCDPDLMEVPIPCNDDAVRSVQLILGRLADAINEEEKALMPKEKIKFQFKTYYSLFLLLQMGNITAKLVKILETKLVQE